jgi:hypothetical protein
VQATGNMQHATKNKQPETSNQQHTIKEDILALIEM